MRFTRPTFLTILKHGVVISKHTTISLSLSTATHLTAMVTLTGEGAQVPYSQPTLPSYTAKTSSSMQRNVCCNHLFRRMCLPRPPTHQCTQHCTERATQHSCLHTAATHTHRYKQITGSETTALSQPEDLRSRRKGAR